MYWISGSIFYDQKTRQKSVLAKGENYNYITDYPQDLYIYNNKTKTEKPLISYEWFPSSAKQILRNYNFIRHALNYKPKLKATSLSIKNNRLINGYTRNIEI